LPANRGLLAAVVMKASGTSERSALVPLSFTANGRRHVFYEGLQPLG
jgi:hypothetical protein